MIRIIIIIIMMIIMIIIIMIIIMIMAGCVRNGTDNGRLFCRGGSQYSASNSQQDILMN